MPPPAIVPRIAVFDSGVGGIGVLAALRDRAPLVDVVYVADHAFGPYGEHELGEVRSRTELIARYLRTAGVELVVVACNSASAAALRHLRSEMPDLAFVGMEPAVKPASERTRSGVVAVLATQATFQGELFQDLVGRHGTDVSIVEQPCPGLAATIEAGRDPSDLLDRYLAPVIDAGADVVVLGCTHYPLIRADIEARLPAGVELIDPAPAVASRAIEVAKERSIAMAGHGATWFWTTATEGLERSGFEFEPIDLPKEARTAARVGDTTLVALAGDITSMEVSVVVNAANRHLQHGGGVALAIARAGGPTIDQESHAWVEEFGPLDSGTAALTSAGSMPASYVVHVAGPIHEQGADNESLLVAAVLAAMESAHEIEASSLAIPAISAGVYGYPADEATVIIAESVAEFLSDGETRIRSVRLVGYDGLMAMRFADAIDQLPLEV